jgi:CTP:molybdopterin cytidylyltransferase MocA
MPKKKSNKTRIEFRKGHQGQRRERGLTEKYADSKDEIDTQNSQRITGKGDLTRHRTVKGNLVESEHRDSYHTIQIDASDTTIEGRVIRVHGLESIVELDDGTILRCAVRRVLKNLSTTQRHVVVTGDKVRIEPQPGNQGWIVRIEPRISELCRTSKNRRHVIASNIDQILVVTSAAEPGIKPNLIDRILATAEQNQYVQKVAAFVKAHHDAAYVPISARIEAELIDLSPEEAKEFLKDLGVTDSGVSNLIRGSYSLLGLQTYFTAGEKEVRCWTIKKGWKAPQAAGVIHTDFEKSFIKAEIVSYEDLVRLGSTAAAREAGKYRLEGKEYVFRDGDVALFKTGA